EQAALRKALAKKPEERFESCEDFVDALERAISPDGKAPRRRFPSSWRGVGSASPRDSTERTHSPGATEPPRREPSATATSSEKNPPFRAAGTRRAGEPPKSSPNIWKPGAPSKRPPGSLQPLLLGMTAIVAVIAVIGLVIAFWPFGQSTTSTTP